ncbi:c-type cytochrome [Ruegeria pomeroyi]|uniref:Cytochrome c n=1 Tax=Ruegeria pomeroyi TaxID=89184 RepID=A0A850LFZ9_9RHOB|nr:cytochrome c [Ruegeria pomeroyi]NVK96828.1 cytochrome c [Ruegeria pomeroyi]NVL02496.1 cytochrome c [Ruegeria pomeroyi]HCE70019.1 cytochrome c [Ruegeria sp.]
MADTAFFPRLQAGTALGTGKALLTIAAFLATTAFAAETLDPDALRRLVQQDCGSCHGLTLKGGLGPDIRPEALGHFDREVLTGVILDGIPDTAMPPWRPLLTEEEAEWIARYLQDPEAR